MRTEMISEEREKARVQKQLAELTEQLHRLNESIAHKQASRNEYDKTIQETEAAYMKVAISFVCSESLISSLAFGCAPSLSDIGILANAVACFEERITKFGEKECVEEGKTALINQSSITLSSPWGEIIKISQSHAAH